MKQYIQVTIPVAQHELREILIAQLSVAGYEAFEEEEAALKAFIETGLFSEQQLQLLLEPHSLAYESSLLPVTNWNEEWEKNFQPVIVDDFCGIRAGFHAPLRGVQHEIVITPKMSFGTGHHATTHMMVQLLRTVDVFGKYVFDFGTGTGILAILACKLGAKAIVAIDNDEWSVLNATENMAANDCGHISLSLSGNIPTHRPFDIILANINRHVIEATMTQLKAVLKPGGYALLSGLLQEDFEDIVALAEHSGLQYHERLERLGWIGLKFRLPE